MSDIKDENQCVDEYEQGTEQLIKYGDQGDDQFKQEVDENGGDHGDSNGDHYNPMENAATDGDVNNFDTEVDPEEPEQFRKLFIGSLNYITTEETLRTYFGQYGHIVDCVIMKEPKTNK
jgi:RNA recognition motif-containing protein